MHTGRTTTKMDISLIKEHSWVQWEHLGLAHVLIMCNSAKLARELGSKCPHYGRACGPTLPDHWNAAQRDPQNESEAMSCLSAPSWTLPAGPVRGAAEMDMQSCTALFMGVQMQKIHTFQNRMGSILLRGHYK